MANLLMQTKDKRATKLNVIKQVVIYLQTRQEYEETQYFMSSFNDREREQKVCAYKIEEQENAKQYILDKIGEYFEERSTALEHMLKEAKEEGNKEKVKKTYAMKMELINFEDKFNDLVTNYLQ